MFTFRNWELKLLGENNLFTPAQSVKLILSFIPTRYWASHVLADDRNNLFIQGCPLPGYTTPRSCKTMMEVSLSYFFSVCFYYIIAAFLGGLLYAKVYNDHFISLYSVPFPTILTPDLPPSPSPKVCYFISYHLFYLTFYFYFRFLKKRNHEIFNIFLSISSLNMVSSSTYFECVDCF